MSNTWLKAKKVVESIVTENHRKSAINYIKLALKDCKRRVIQNGRIERKSVGINQISGYIVYDNYYGPEHDELNNMLFSLDPIIPLGPE